MGTAIMISVEISRDGSMTVWSEDGRPIYLSKEQAQAVHMAYAHNSEDPECPCFVWGHEHCAENGHE